MAPMEYSVKFSMFCFVVFLLSSYTLLKNNCKQTFVKFEFFFLVAYFFANISYAVFTYPIRPYFGLFYLEFNENYICKGLALSLVGICAFNIGIFEKIPQYINKEKFPSLQLKSPQLLFYLLFAGFLPMLLSIFLSGEYSTSFEGSYYNTILMYVIYCILVVFFYQNRNASTIKQLVPKYISIIPILISLYVLLFLLIGSRTIPMRIILSCLFLFAVFIKIPSKIIILSSLVVGAVCFTILGAVRGGGDFYLDSILNILSFGDELTMTNRSVYVLMEYADIHGFNWGKTMLFPVICIIPFAMSFILYITGMHDYDFNTASMITNLYYSNTPNTEGHIGLGTNIIGDIYVSFGLVGVILLMYYMGRVIRYFYSNICQKGDIVSVLLYATIIMDAIYWPRSVYLTPVRTMAWTYLFFWLYNKKYSKIIK